MKSVWAFIAFLLLSTRAFADGPNVIAPLDGYHSSKPTVWLVVAGGSEPQIFVDTAPKQVKINEVDGVYHIKVEGLKPGATRIDVRQGAMLKTLTVNYSSDRKLYFHADADRACDRCHKSKGAPTCDGCHVLGKSGHSSAIKKSCVVCHDKPGKMPTDVAQACGKCHKKHSDKSHPKLKHPIKANNDPNRPGRPMNCVSCHDPHSPISLGKMAQSDLREWCKICHKK